MGSIPMRATNNSWRIRQEVKAVCLSSRRSSVRIRHALPHHMDMTPQRRKIGCGILGVIGFWSLIGAVILAVANGHGDIILWGIFILMLIAIFLAISINIFNFIIEEF